MNIQQKVRMVLLWLMKAIAAAVAVDDFYLLLLGIGNMGKHCCYYYIAAAVAAVTFVLVAVDDFYLLLLGIGNSTRSL
jgi:hypothetical protein